MAALAAATGNTASPKRLGTRCCPGCLGVSWRALPALVLTGLHWVEVLGRYGYQGCAGQCPLHAAGAPMHHAPLRQSVRGSIPRYLRATRQPSRPLDRQVASLASRVRCSAASALCACAIASPHRALKCHLLGDLMPLESSASGACSLSIVATTTKWSPDAKSGQSPHSHWPLAQQFMPLWNPDHHC